MRFAAIDIGSNAARLLISEVTPPVQKGQKAVFTKLNLLRIPLRLGFDVFKDKEIHPEKEQMIVDTMSIYAQMMKVYRVKGYKACATSAMRDAVNGKSVIDRVEKETGVHIDIISGGEEAGLLFETHIAETLNPNQSYMYIDVGGGSTEITLFSKNKIVMKHSFNIGTIRVLENQVTDAQWKEMNKIIKDNVSILKDVTAIGCGGNINKIFSISKTKEGFPLTLLKLNNYYKEMSAISVTQRMEKYNFRLDRADVVVPALEIFTKVMKWGGASKIFVPKIGLADGLIKQLYDNEVKA